MTREPTSRSRRRLTATVTDLEVRVQRAFLVGVELPGMSSVEAERSLDELALLTDTAVPVDREWVPRRRSTPPPIWARERQRSWPRSPGPWISTWWCSTTRSH